jgi:Trypsin-like peptidase domain
MSTHLHAEHPWRVGVAGHRRGAGVLLDERHVLTCAHVVGDARKVTVRSAGCRPEWRATARVAPGSWVHRDDETLRGDVTLLVLDEPAPCDAHATLWLAPISGGMVRAYGFPRTEPHGIPADAELGGDAGHRGRGGEFALLNRVGTGGQWIEPGFSGAGVLKLDGDHAGHVIGMIVADYRNADARAAWMMPIETILRYLPDIARYVAGEPTDRLGASDGGLPELAHGDTLRVALTRELARLLTDGWAGTVVLPGGGDTGTAWLVRLVRTADPATRAGTSDAELTAAPRHTVLGLGTIDAAYDARGRSATEVTRYFSARFGLPPGHPDPVREILRRKPPACIVIDGADRAEDPGALMREVLRPLAVGAGSRGVRLVLGFDGPVPENLPYEVSLDPEPIDGGSPRLAVAVDVEARIAELAAAEADAATLSAGNERRFRKPPPLPPTRAPRLRVRLAVASAARQDPELAAVDEAAVAALGEIASFRQRSERMDHLLDDLRSTLEVNQVRAARYLPEEDQDLADWYGRARRALWQAPIDVDAAGTAVIRYVAEVDRRIGNHGRAGGKVEETNRG